MAVRTISELKKCFRKGMYPTESQFADWLESYRHKGEKLGLSEVEGLAGALNGKYDAGLGRELAAMQVKQGEELERLVLVQREQGKDLAEVSALAEGVMIYPFDWTCYHGIELIVHPIGTVAFSVELGRFIERGESGIIDYNEYNTQGDDGKIRPKRDRIYRREDRLYVIRHDAETDTYRLEILGFEEVEKILVRPMVENLDRRIDGALELIADCADAEDTYAKFEAVGKRIDGALELIADCADTEVTYYKFEAVNERLDNLRQEHEGDVEALEALKLRLETLIGKGDVSAVIDTFNEIEAFLQGVTNTETLAGMLQDLQAAVLLETAKNYQPKGNYLTSHQSLDGLMKKDGSNATAAAVSALINKLETGYTTPTDNDWMLSQYAGGSKPDFLRRPFSKIWDYILTKDGTGSGLDADMLQGTKRHNGYNIFYKDIITVQGTVGSEWYAEIVIGNKWTSDFYEVLVYAPWNNIHGMLRIEKQGLNRYTYETNNYGGINILGVNIKQGDEGRLCVTLKLRSCTAETDELKVYRPDGNTTLRKLDSVPDLVFSPLVPKCYSGTVKAPNFEGTATNIKTQQLTNEDLNDIKTQTFANYWGNASNTCKNKPAGVTIFNLTSRMVSSRFAHFLVDQNGTNWQRSFDGTSWTDWQQIATMSDLEPIKVKTNKLIVGATTARDWSKIPVTHKIVTGSLNGSDVTLNLAGTGAIPIGESIHCIIKNIHSAVAAVLSLTAFPHRNCETYIIQPGCYAEVNILYDGSEYYLRVI